MAQTPAFKYAPMFQTGEDKTEYYLLTKDHVSVGEFEGKKILKVEAEGLTKLINRAFHDVNFMLRREHNEQVAKILSDPEATANDKYVALMFLRNAETAAKVERIRCNAGFLIQFLRQRSKLCEHSGIKVLVHTQIAQPHTKSEPFWAVHMQTVCHAQKFLTLHPGIGSHDASNRFRAAAQRPLLAQEQNRRFRRFLRKQVGSVQHENRAERTRSLLGFPAAKQRFIGNLSVMEPAPCSKFQLCAAPAEHTAAAAVQNLQNSGIRIHADGKARQESVAVGKCTEKSLRCLHETLFIV